MQTERITLPEDPAQPGVEQWAEIRHVSTMRAGDGKAIRRTMKFKVGVGDDDEGMTITAGDLDDRVDALLVRVIVTWSYPLPLPAADRASLDELPVDAWSALREATAPHLAAVDFDQRRTPTGGGDSSDSRTTSADTPSLDTPPTKT